MLLPILVLAPVTGIHRCFVCGDLWKCWKLCKVQFLPPVSFYSFPILLGFHLLMHRRFHEIFELIWYRTWKFFACWLNKSHKAEWPAWNLKPVFHIMLQRLQTVWQEIKTNPMLLQKTLMKRVSTEQKGQDKSWKLVLCSSYAGFHVTALYALQKQLNTDIRCHWCEQMKGI